MKTIVVCAIFVLELVSSFPFPEPAYYETYEPQEVQIPALAHSPDLYQQQLYIEQQDKIRRQNYENLLRNQDLNQRLANQILTRPNYNIQPVLNTVREPYLNSIPLQRAQYEAPLTQQYYPVQRQQSIRQYQPVQQEYQVATEAHAQAQAQVGNSQGASQPATNPYHYSPQKLAYHPRIQQVLASTPLKKRYLVIHPNGNIEHMDKIEHIVEQHPNYILVNAGSVTPPTKTAKPAQNLVVQAPVAPQAPGAPQTPMVPQAPGAPQTPLAPKAPVAPAAPQAPVAPQTPVAPLAPVPPSPPVQKTPLTPVTPISKTPAAPNGPTASNGPVVPTAPNTPPKTPVVPSPAAAPVAQAPNAPNTPVASAPNAPVASASNAPVAPSTTVQKTPVAHATAQSNTVPAPPASVPVNLAPTPVNPAPVSPGLTPVKPAPKLGPVDPAPAPNSPIAGPNDPASPSKPTSIQTGKVPGPKPTIQPTGPAQPPVLLNSTVPSPNKPLPPPVIQNGTVPGPKPTVLPPTGPTTEKPAVSAPTAQPPVSVTATAVYPATTPLAVTTEPTPTTPTPPETEATTPSPVTATATANATAEVTKPVPSTTEDSNQPCPSKVVPYIEPKNTKTDVDILQVNGAKPVVWFRTDDVNFWKKLSSGNEKFDVMYFFNVPREPRVTKETKTTIHADGTVVEELTQTIYDDEDSPPRVIKTTTVTKPDGTQSKT
ncbi:vegetative cell wall protein gp1-like isoform X2 [Leguminivora glycinivorella]|uniref:vegetative cell wall protein gp1-like isoform X2 n=1 Tax=Leguminivora glycinivorella TaxID=1035111 RepID=UPI00200F6B1D|nr:vegetative cell wall protein gp1-like isoform X2 [Leguminivora glycinivorella]